MSTSNDDKDDDNSCNTCFSCPDPNESLYGKPVFQDPGAGQGYD